MSAIKKLGCILEMHPNVDQVDYSCDGEQLQFTTHDSKSDPDCWIKNQELVKLIESLGFEVDSNDCEDCYNEFGVLGPKG